MNTTEHFSGKVAVKAMITDGEKVLITRSEGDEMWDFPGGRIDEGEALEDAVVREVREEIGAEVEIEGMFCSVQTMHFKDGKHILFAIFKGTLKDPSAPFTNDDREADETKWVTKNDFDSLTLFPQCVKPLKMLWSID